MFDIKRALQLAYYSSLVYKGYTDVENALKGYEFHWFDKDGTQALIVITKEGDIILSFRGTEPENLGDWVSDINISKTKTKFGYIHSGFWEAYNNIGNDIQATFDTMDLVNTRNIYITGHSLGGALAMIGAFFLRIPVAGVYTFGCPRVGDKTFANNFDTRFSGRTYRLVNNCDIVTRTPPRIGSYQHCEQLVYIDKDGKFHIEDSLNWWVTFWDRAGGRLENFVHLKLFDGVEDHKLNNYVKAIELDISRT